MEQLSLCWNNFKENLAEGFQSLREKGELFDVTIACDGRQFQAHSTVLAVCSTYFREILVENPARPSIIILKDISGHLMELLLRFMYNGTVIVDNAELESLMKHAEHLRIKGLTQRVRSGAPSPVPSGSVRLGHSDSSGGHNNGHLHGSSSPPLYAGVAASGGAGGGGGGGGVGGSGALHIPSPTHSESEEHTHHAHHRNHHHGPGRLLKRKWNEDLEDELNSDTSSDVEYTNHTRTDHHHQHQQHQQQQQQQQQQHHQNHNLNHHHNLNTGSTVAAGAGLEQGSRRSPPSMVFRLPRTGSDHSLGTGAVDYTSPGGDSAQQQQQQQQQALFPNFERIHGNFIASVASAAAAAAATTTTVATAGDEGTAATGNGGVSVGPTHNDSTGSTDSFPTRSPRLMDVPAVAPGEKWFQGRLQFMLSQRGKPLLVHDGHSFGIQYIRKDKKYWQCNLSRKYNCKARVTTTDTGDIIVTNNEHCHTEIRQHLRKDYKTMKLAATLAATRASFDATNLAVASSAASATGGHATTAAAAVAAVAAAAAAAGTQQAATEPDQMLTLNLSSSLWPIKRETNQCND